MNVVKGKSKIWIVYFFSDVFVVDVGINYGFILFKDIVFK